MAAKTTRKTFATIVAEQEATILAEAPKLLAEIEQARELITTRGEEREEAEDRLSDILGAFKRGDASHSAADLAEARAAVERAELLTTGQRAKADRLTKAAPQTDKRLAEMVAESVSKVVPYAAEVIPSFVRPAEAPEYLLTGPIVVITQDAPAKERDGKFGAGITIRSFRLPHFQQIDARDLEEDFKARGWFIPSDRIYQNTERHDSFMVDVVRVQELVAYASTPVIAKDPTESDVNPVIGTLSNEMVRAFPIQGDVMAGVSFQPGNGASSEFVSVKPRNRRFKVTKTGAERRTVVEVEYEVRGENANVSEGAALTAAMVGLNSMPGKFFAGVGVVEKVSTFDLKTPSPNYLGARVELVSLAG
ncbi:hypothetical protein [Streptomyces sp. NPDC101237]|uniref:hypothetical protein n=1 Tax=Streptomyces sp. NPDC101237 TaxID=3366139 RepID=UPI0038268F4D